MFFRGFGRNFGFPIGPGLPKCQTNAIYKDEIMFIVCLITRCYHVVVVVEQLKLSSMTLNEIPAKVLFGDKWIGNKWVRWQEQVFLFYFGSEIKVLM